MAVSPPKRASYGLLPIQNTLWLSHPLLSYFVMVLTPKIGLSPPKVPTNRPSDWLLPVQNDLSMGLCACSRSYDRIISQVLLWLYSQSDALVMDLTLFRMIFRWLRLVSAVKVLRWNRLHLNGLFCTYRKIHEILVLCFPQLKSLAKGLFSKFLCCHLFPSKCVVPPVFSYKWPYPHPQGRMDILFPFRWFMRSVSPYRMVCDYLIGNQEMSVGLTDMIDLFPSTSAALCLVGPRKSSDACFVI